MRALTVSLTCTTRDCTCLTHCRIAVLLVGIVSHCCGSADCSGCDASAAESAFGPPVIARQMSRSSCFTGPVCAAGDLRLNIIHSCKDTARLEEYPPARKLFLNS